MNYKWVFFLFFNIIIILFNFWWDLKYKKGCMFKIYLVLVFLVFLYEISIGFIFLLLKFNYFDRIIFVDYSNVIFEIIFDFFIDVIRVS